ncbi:MAG TPA: serine hydrolase domain-containing protein [Vicinamibacteria bacterium]|jgi:CubicO group peptidase (beta-lactamase class C family)|nr:serine hydrolase domain-containing protein [Vicinamibacteria bacterium]
MMRWLTGPVLASLIVTTGYAAAPTPDVQDAAGQLETFGARLEGVGFSGALLVAKDGRILLSKAYGYADRARGIRNTVDTVFPVGSITKQFTAAGILALEQRGALSTGDPITKYFRDVPPDKVGITIHHLLTHSSGLVGSLGGDKEPIGWDDFFKLVMKSKLLWPPGTKYEYSNVGFSVLAGIIEHVSGQPWERFLRENLFLPAGMQQTGCVLPKFAPDMVPHGYQDDDDVGTFIADYGPEGPYWHLRGNGGINSTIGDMYRWHQALLGDTVLSAESRRKAFTPYVREGDDADSFYGYGWALFKSPRGTNIVTHNGGNGIFTAEMIRFVDEGVVVYGAANDSAFAAWEQTPRLAALLFGGTVEVPPAVVALPGPALEELVGHYTVPSGSGFDLQKHGGGLLALPDGQEAVNALAAVRPQSQARYATVAANTQTLLERIVAGRTSTADGDSAWDVSEEMYRREQARRQRLESDLGRLKAAHVLGTLPAPEGRGRVIARLDFAKGSRYLRCLWGPGGRLWHIRELGQPVGVQLFSESPTVLFSYTPSSGGIRRVEIVRRVDGRVEALALQTPSGPVRATRMSPKPSSGSSGSGESERKP